MEHTHTWYGWLNHHSGEIIFIWFPLVCGYLNAFAASFKVMGWTRLADELGKTENAIKAFVDAMKAQRNQPPDTTGTTGGK